MVATQSPTFEEWLACTELDFEWAESYDSKDWTRLQAILAPTLTINYAKVTNTRYDDLPASEFLSMVSNPLFLGDPLVDSQHLIGAAAKWIKQSDTEILGLHQSRAAHIRWNNEEKTSVAATGHGHGRIEILYRKVGGVWKWGGITTHVRWNEHEWENVFLGVDGKKVGVSSEAEAK